MLVFSLGLRFTNPEGFVFPFPLLSHRDSLRISVPQVANTKRETVFKWLKDDVLYETETPPDLEKGVCELLIPKVPCCHHGNKPALAITQKPGSALWFTHRFPMFCEANVQIQHLVSWY